MIYTERLFRIAHGFRKGDDPETNTQSNPVNTQTDNRVGASESGVAVGSGGYLDQSFTDNSRTELNTIDNSDRSFTDNSQTVLNTSDNRDQSDRRQFIDNSDRSFTDQSQTVLNTSDNRDLSSHVTDSRSFTDNSDNSDRRSFVDNSVHNDLSGELVKATLNNGSEALKSAGSVLEKSLVANSGVFDTAAALVRTTNGQALSLVENAVGKLLDKSAEQTAATVEEQTKFLNNFYTDRENSDVKTIDGLAQKGAAVAVLGLLAWALKS